MILKMAEGGSSHINATGSDRPLLKDLYDHVVNNVAGKWRDLGVQLLRPDQEKMLDIIAADHPHDVVSCCKCVLNKWLNTTTDATWNELIRALRSASVQLDYLAGQLEQMMITESTVTSADIGNACNKLTKIHHIEVQFAKMTRRIKQALIDNNVDVVLLIEQLCAISVVKSKKVPLFDEDVFERIKSIDELWKRLRIFWNVFDYELLYYIVEISECGEAKEIFEEFLSRIDPSAIKDADLMLHCKIEDREGLLKPVLRIKVNSEECTPDVEKRVKEIVSKVYELDKYALCFQGIKEGCIELLYCISKPLKLYLLEFKISKGGMEKFLVDKIISLHIEKYELRIPSSISDITDKTFTWLECPEQTTDIPAVRLTSKLRGVAVIVGNSYTREDLPLRRKLVPLPSSPKDVDKLKQVFEYLKFFTIIKMNATRTDLLESFLYPLGHSSGPHTCHRFVFAFCGHGGDDFIYCEDEECVKFIDIIESISHYESFKSIPRIFFFDVSRGTDLFTKPGNWQSQISKIDDILVAHSTSPGYETFDSAVGSIWIGMLARRLITCAKSVRDVVMKANEELITTMQCEGSLCLQKPELFDKLKTPVNLLTESGYLDRPPKEKPDIAAWVLPKAELHFKSRKCRKTVVTTHYTPIFILQGRPSSIKIDQVLPGLKFYVDTSISALPAPGKKFSKNPKSLLNEFCHSKKFSLPKYQHQISENGLVVVTISIMIDGQEVHYSYTSEEAQSTMKCVKQCEENAAEMVFTTLSDRYGSTIAGTPIQSSDRPSGKKNSRNPKSKLNEFCQSKKFSLPKYQTSEDHFVVTVSIMIRGQDVCYSYTSKQAMLTKKDIKQCEEYVAEIAFTALTKLYGTCLSSTSPQRTQSCDENSDKSMPHPSVKPELQKTSSCLEIGSPGKEAKSQLNELFQKHGINVKYDSRDDVTSGNVHNFTATLTYIVHGRSYRYESRGVFGRKQDAEEDAAQQALCKIEQQLQKHPVTTSRGGAVGNHYKSLLKERHCDERQLPAPQYTTEITSGGFVSTVNVPKHKPIRGAVGGSKKEAEQLAAMEALRKLKINF